MQERTWEEELIESEALTEDKKVLLERTSDVDEEKCDVESQNVLDLEYESDEENILPDTSIKPRKFSKSYRVKSSKRILIPFFIISVVFFVMGYFSEVVVGVLFSAKEMNELAEKSPWLSENMSLILHYVLYVCSVGMVFLGFKAVNNGVVQVFDSHIVHRKGLFNKDKIHFINLASVEVYRSPFSVFFDVGHIEILTAQKEIKIAHVYNPFFIKELIEDKRSKYQR